MQRREFVFGLLIAGFICRPAHSQQRSKVPQVGLLSPESASETRVNGFREGLEQLGYIDGKNIHVEYRWANGAFNRLPSLAAELVKLNVDVIVAYVTQASIEAKKATTSIPIVMVGVADPVGAGLIASLAHPGDNVTGTSSIAADLVGKQIELFKQILPGTHRIAVLWNPANFVFQTIQMKLVKDAAQASGLELQLVEARSADDFTNGFAAISNEGTRGVLVLAEPVFESNFPTLARLALENRLVSVGARTDFAQAGGLVSYGTNFTELYRRAAVYVDKILRGARPDELPVEQPTRFDMVLNLRTAKALEIVIPPSLLARANEVID